GATHHRRYIRHITPDKPEIKAFRKVRLFRLLDPPANPDLCSHPPWGASPPLTPHLPRRRCAFCIEAGFRLPGQTPAQTLQRRRGRLNCMTLLTALAHPLL